MIYCTISICRFWQPDPKAHDYHWLSPYAYCGGDPINFIDPTGQVLTTVCNGITYTWSFNAEYGWGFYDQDGQLYDGAYFFNFGSFSTSCAQLTLRLHVAIDPHAYGAIPRLRRKATSHPAPHQPDAQRPESRFSTCADIKLTPSETDYMQNPNKSASKMRHPAFSRSSVKKIPQNTCKKAFECLYLRHKPFIPPSPLHAFA